MEDDEIDSEDEILQELLAVGKIKPGLNIPLHKKTDYVNNVPELNRILTCIKLDTAWIERLDIVNKPASLAPELCMEFKEQEEFVKSGRSDSLSLNEFKREILFHRQAQLAVLEGIARLKSQGVPTIRPDDYFAEMMKSDEHMQKVRHSLLQKQAGLERSEKMKKIRSEKKFAKQKQVETTLRKQKEKRTLSEEIKKYRKGMRTNLDFLEKKTPRKMGESNRLNKKRISKNEKYGFGPKRKNGFKRAAQKNRPGKSRRKNKNKSY